MTRKTYDGMLNENEYTVKGYIGMYMQINSTEKVRGKKWN